MSSSRSRDLLLRVLDLCRRVLEKNLDPFEVDAVGLSLGCSH